ncbi:hypothetical protein BGZ72_002188 [Mortierella alpina]|nr:hypothetical protein BGZ72_002188 [Mortierella alpina]
MTLPTELQGFQHPEVAIPGLGKVKGVLDEEHPVAKFLNIPFGVATTTLSLFAEMFGQRLNVVYDEEMSERDCLSLNIYMPASALNYEQELPVCVWIYGGGFTVGSITTPLYDCTQLVATSIEQNTPMIVVSINYRVNYFGFMSSKELALDAQTYANAVPERQRRWYDGSVGNWGFLDQILGLEWVRDHIHAFRGDPGRVTAMGESAGSASISYLMMIPQCRGLFHRAIMQSGAASTLPTARPDQEGQRYFDHLCRVFNIPSDLSGAEKVTRLRGIPEKDLAEELNGSEVMNFTPTLDGVLFKEDSRLATQDSSFYDPNLHWVVMGTCGDEGEFAFCIASTHIFSVASCAHQANLYVFRKPMILSGTMFTTMFKATNPENIAKLRSRLCAPGDGPVFDQLFGVPTNDKEATDIGSRLFDNCIFRYPVYQASEAILAHPYCRLTRYHFDVRAEKYERMPLNWKAFHGLDLQFTFGNKISATNLSEEEMSLSKEMQQVWIDVITSKSPEESSLPKIKSIQPASIPEDQNMGKDAIVFGRDLKVGRGLVERMSVEEVGFWERSFLYVTAQAQLGRGVEVGMDFFKAL